MKLIKLTEEHYVIVDDSEIKETDWCVYFKQDMNDLLDVTFIFQAGSIELDSANKLGVVCGEKIYVYVNDCKKITHSTKPLINKPKNQPYNTLILSEVEELIYGYSVEKMANTQWGNVHRSGVLGYIEGFKADMEITKDKLFTIEDMKQALITMGLITSKNPQGSAYKIDGIIQSILKTEWDVEFDENNKLRLI